MTPPPPVPRPPATLYDGVGGEIQVGAACVDLANFKLASVLSTYSVVQLFCTDDCGSGVPYCGLVYPDPNLTPIPADFGSQVKSALLP